jgi:predicted RNA-binding protein (virulence factor B family)
MSWNALSIALRATLARITATTVSDKVLEAMFDTLDDDSDDEAITAMRYKLDFDSDFFVADGITLISFPVINI